MSCVCRLNLTDRDQSISSEVQRVIANANMGVLLFFSLANRSLGFFRVCVRVRETERALYCIK